MKIFYAGKAKDLTPQMVALIYLASILHYTKPYVPNLPKGGQN